MKVENLSPVKLRKLQKNLEVHKQSPVMNVNCVVETTRLNSVLMKERFSLGTDTTSSDSKEKLPDRKSKSVDYLKTQRR